MGRVGGIREVYQTGERRGVKIERICPDQHAIEACRQKAIEGLYEEEKCFGTFEEQYNALEGFREELKKYIRWISPHKKLFRPKSTLIETGDVLDWHVLGYFAPLDFRKISWGGAKEHLQNMLLF